MMRYESLKIIEQDLRKISDMLLLNGTLTECPGLVHGKIGIAIFFFHYAKLTGNELFADYAMDLIGEMLEQIHVNSPADYERGIASIGVGIDYLIRNDFLNVEYDVCEDFDQRMVRAVMYEPWLDFSQYNGLIGYGRYWITRLHNKVSSMQARKCLLYIITLIEEKMSDISIKEQTDVYCFLYDLQGISGFNDLEMRIIASLQELDLQSADVTRSFSRLGYSSVGNIARMFQQSRYFKPKQQVEINAALTQIPDLDMEKTPASTGLLTGYAGEGMLRLTVIEPSNIEWMNLL